MTFSMYPWAFFLIQPILLSCFDSYLLEDWFAFLSKRGQIG